MRAALSRAAEILRTAPPGKLLGDVLGGVSILLMWICLPDALAVLAEVLR